MASRSSRQKSASRSPSIEHIAKLLQDKAVFQSPTVELTAAAEHLRALGILDASISEYVRCVLHEDQDFSFTNRQCSGRIYVSADLSDGDRRCPTCDRRVFPDQYEKRRFIELRSHVSRDGVIAYIGTALAELDSNLRQVTQGVFRLDVDDATVHVCLVEYCGDERYLSRERAISNPTCFIAVNSRDFEERFLEEEWVQRLRLAEVVCGAANLYEVVRTTAVQNAPAMIRQVSIPVCGNSPLSVIVEPIQPPTPGRLFTVEVGTNIVRVDDVKVVAKQAGPRFIIFSVLWDWFLDDLKAGLVPEMFHAQPLRYLIHELEVQTGKKYPDETTVRRAINRLQEDIAKTIKREVGLPIDREDIIQTCRKQGQTDNDFGYRINPFSVSARAFRADLSQET